MVTNTTNPASTAKKEVPKVAEKVVAKPPVKNDEPEWLTKEDNTSFLHVYKTKIILGVVLLFVSSIIYNLVLILDNDSLERKSLKLSERLQAAIALACNVDIKKEPKKISFIKEENAEGDEILVLKCVPIKKKEE